VLEHTEDTFGVVNIAPKPVGAFEKRTQQIVGFETIELLETFVGGSGEELLDDQLDLLLVGLVAHEVAVDVELVRHADGAESFGEKRLKLTGPTFHFERDLRLLRVDLATVGLLDFVNQRVDGLLDGLVGEQGRALPRMSHTVGQQQLGKHRTRLRGPLMELVGQPLAALIVAELLGDRTLLCVFAGRRLVGWVLGVLAEAISECHGRHPRTSFGRLPFLSMTNQEVPDRNLALELVRVTEAAAMAASRWMGRGDKEGADGAAVDAMRVVLGTVPMDGVVVIGEGEKDEAPMLYNGEHIGDGSPPQTDIAVDPIDGTTLTALGRGNAIAVIAVAPRGTMFDPGPCVYMEKIAVGPEAAGVISMDNSVTENLHAVAEAKRESIRDLTAVILDRDRHNDIIAEVREAGARIRLIPDGDVAGAISTAWPDSGADILFGIGGTPEGVITAAALKSMGGQQLGRLWPRNERERTQAVEAGYDLTQVLTNDDLIRSDDCFFAATGITDGDLLRGVHFDSRGCHTDSLVMRSRSRTVRKVEAHHQIDKLSEFSSINYA